MIFRKLGPRVTVMPLCDINALKIVEAITHKNCYLSKSKKMGTTLQFI